MKTIIISLLSISILGCSSSNTEHNDKESDIQKVDVERISINPAWVVETISRQQDIEDKLIRLLTALKADSETRTIDFQSLGLSPYSK